MPEIIVDSHAHPQFGTNPERTEGDMDRALEANTCVIIVGSHIDTSRKALATAKKNPLAYVAIGSHPLHADKGKREEGGQKFRGKGEDFGEQKVNYSRLVEHPRVVAVGECGLDYSYLPSREPENEHSREEIIEKQKRNFIRQIRFAKKHNKALVVHSRTKEGEEQLYQEMLAILSGEHVEKMRFMMHGYNYTPEYLEHFLKLGAYVSYGGSITFDTTGNMEKLVKMTPRDRLLLETDAPYLTPKTPETSETYGNIRNEPSFVKFVAQRVAEIKGISFEEVARITTTNAKRLFNLPI